MAGNGQLRANALLCTLTISLGVLAVVAPTAQAAAAPCPSPVVDLAPVVGGNSLGYKYVNHFASVPGVDEAFAVGGDEEDDFNNPGIPSVPYIQHWDGSSWSPFTAPAPTGFSTGAEALAVDDLSTSDVWVAGLGSSDSWSTFTGW